MTDESDREPAPARHRRAKRKPPVIEAKAKDVTPPSEPEPAAEAQSVAAEAAPQPETAAPEPAPETPPPPSAQAFDWRAALPAMAVAAVSGLGAGLAGAWLFAAAPPPPADTSGINNAIAQLSSRLTQQETKPQAAIPDLKPLSERSAKLETATGELRGQLAEVRKLIEAQAKTPAPTVDLSAVNRRLAAIEEKVGALAAASKPEPRNDTQPAEVIALGALRDAVVAGAPFANELHAVRVLLKERAAALAPLDPFAKDGLPTIAALAKRFEPLAAKLANPPPPDGGVFTRLWNNAGKLVEVRPVGEPQGADAGAVVARMETKLARGDLAGALDEAKALPSAARETAKDWFEAAERRRDADAAIKHLINAALAAISAERPKQ